MTIADETEHPSKFASSARDAVKDGKTVELTVAGRTVRVDGPAAAAILDVVEYASAGASVLVTPLEAELTTGQAADLLGVSRPTVVDLVDSGKLPGHKVGTHRRIRANDALAFQEQQRAERHQAMDEFIALTEELGI